MCQCRKCKGQACVCSNCAEKDKCGYVKIDECRWVRIGGKKGMAESGADFDITGKYRYKLWRTWDKGKPTILFIMLNPSTANAETDDPTIRRCVNFAKSWGYGGIEVVNLFALVSSDPDKLLTTSNSIGENNDQVIIQASGRANKIIVAWGAFKEAIARGKEVVQLLNKFDICCLGRTKSGHPKHPLYLRGDLNPVIYEWKNDEPPKIGGQTC